MYDLLFYKPIYNLMIFLSNHLPDFGWAILVSTIIIKFILYPLYSAQIKNQIAVKKAQPELKKIQEKMKKPDLNPMEKQMLVMEMLETNKKYGVKMFTPILNMIIQLTILITLYLIIYKSGFPKIKTEELYSFVSAPENLKMTFLGYIDLLKPSIILAVLAGITQFLYFQVSMPEVKFSDLKKKSENLQEDFAKSFQVYMKYGMPFLAFMVLLGLNAAIGIYWVTSNIFMTFQEWLVRKDKNELKEINN